MADEEIVSGIFMLLWMLSVCGAYGLGWSAHKRYGGPHG
jgi:hypothetical protein